MSSRIVRWTDADGDLDSFARRLCADHPGDVLDVDQPDLVAALTAHGGDLVRRSVLMGRDLRPLPTDGAGVADGGGAGSEARTVAPMVPDPERYAGAMLRAFPPHHVDYDPDIPDEAGARRALASYFAGEIIGPFLPEGSREAVVGGSVAGGVVVSDRPASDGQDPGPWVTDAFVDPAFQGQGIGWALFSSAIDGLRRAGHETIGLAVHADNPAQQLYRRLGFVERSRWARIAL